MYVADQRLAETVNDQTILPVGDIANNFDPNPMIRKHGRGPEGVKCKTCRHLISTCPTGNRTYLKCDLYSVSRSDATDFRLQFLGFRPMPVPEVTEDIQIELERTVQA